MRYQFLVGVLCTANFLVFWALPIALQGLVFKHFLKYLVRPFYNLLDKSPHARAFALKFVYSKPQYTDFFATSVFMLISTAIMLGSVFWYQSEYGYLSWPMIVFYNFAWVGFGGRGMGAAYSFAHKEGHARLMYRKWIRETVGNVFENWVGLFYGNVPYNFTTSHIQIHHRLDGGIGDTFYQWDLDRTSWHDLMIYQHRILTHMTGLSSYQYFSHNPKYSGQRFKLLKGMITYWLIMPTIILLLTQSLSFLFFVYIQPLFCMTYFLAFINFGLHAFIEFDENGKHIKCVNSSCILEDDDDYFGESDHMAHHYYTSVFYSDLPDHHKTQIAEWAKHHASVFKKFSIVEMSLFILLKDWNTLAEHYVDYADPKLPKAEVMAMLERRAKRKEMEFDDYTARIEHYQRATSGCLAAGSDGKSE
mmetsp:Transcript_53441/g.134305  ORF Transcript_53441/g.134305 Transcript_53441/m.134305 type:complete len:419 (+) Transcript_53441:180-1436(+)